MTAKLCILLTQALPSKTFKGIKLITLINILEII